jgi:hypothetical protein
MWTTSILKLNPKLMTFKMPFARAGGMVQVVPCLPSNHEALNSNLDTAKKQKQKQTKPKNHLQCPLLSGTLRIDSSRPASENKANLKRFSIC